MLKIQKPWFIVVAPVAPAYAEPNFNSAKVTEAISGESVQILAQNRGWVRVEQDDGYKSWIRDFYGRFDDDPFPATHMIINRGNFPFGMRVELIRENIITADGKAHSLDLKLKPLIQKSDPDGILEISQNLRGCPYRWGGKTSFGYDCSGLLQSILNVFIIVIAGGITRHIAIDRTVTVGIVIPAGGTDPRTKVPLVGQVNLCQQVKTIGDDIPTVKFAIRLVEIRVVHDRAVLAFRPDAEVVANSVIPTHPNIWVTQIYLHRRGAATGQ